MAHRRLLTNPRGRADFWGLFALRGKPDGMTIEFHQLIFDYVNYIIPHFVFLTFRCSSCMGPSVCSMFWGLRGWVKNGISLARLVRVRGRVLRVLGGCVAQIELNQN